MNPHLVQAHYDLGLLFFKQEHMEEAQQSIQQALTIYPRFWEARLTLAKMYDQRGEIDKAIEEYQRVLTHQPLASEALYLLAYQQEDEPQKAIQHFQRVTELNPTDAEAFFNVGVLLVGANQLEKAETAYKTGIELQPKSIEGQFNLGAFYEFQKKDLPQAKKHYQNYLQLGGTDTRIQQLLDKLQP